MKKTGAAIVALVLAATPALADRKVDEAKAKAGEQIAKGKPDDALKTMQKLVGQNPTAEAYTELGRVQDQLGDLDEAVTSLKKAVELSAGAGGPARAAALAALAGLELRTASARDALAHAEEAAKLHPSPTTLAALARAQARVGNTAAALQTAEQAVQAGAASADAHEAKGEALLAAGKPAEAAAAFRKAAEADPRAHLARVGMAKALLAQGKAAEAVAEARKATELNEKSGEAFAVLGLAILAENKNNWNDAIAQAQQGAFLNPKNPYVQVAVGRLFEAAGNMQQATAAYNRALQSDPGYGPAQAAQVKALANSGKVEEALPVVEKLAQSNPNDPEVQLIYGRLLARKGDWVAAAAPLGKAAEALPSSAEAQALAGTAMLHTRQLPEALEVYKKAVALDPQNVAYRATYGLVLGLNKQYQEGIAELKKVVATPGYKDTAGYTNLGWVLRSIDPPRGPESVAAYQKALELDPKNAQAALGLGWALSLVDKYDEAIAAFQKATQLEPKLTAEAYNGVAWAHYFKKDMVQAKAMAAKARAEGRNVASLLSAIDRFEKGVSEAAEAARRSMQQEQAEESSVVVAGRTILNQRGAPAARVRALQEIVSAGASAVEYVIFAAINDPDLGVREQAFKSLASLAGAARGQCAQVKQVAFGPNPYDSLITQDRKQLDLAAQYGDVQKAARAASQRIGCN